jgi:hypothetical protein
LLSAQTMLLASFKRKGLRKLGPAEDRRSAEQVQIVNEASRVVGWTIRGLRSDPISTLRPAPGRTAKEELPGVPALGGDDEVLVSARGLEVHGKRYVILVAAPLEVETDAMRTVGPISGSKCSLPRPGRGSPRNSQRPMRIR